jgi:hypothetical protein
MGFLKASLGTVLALAGWYLMIPPVVDGRTDLDAPLSFWMTINRTDSLLKCRAAGSKVEVSVQSNPYAPFYLRDQTKAWKCVATNDPSLK